MQPVLAAFGVALALPDRHARLDLVDDVATGGEAGVAVRGGDAEPAPDVADHHFAGSVHAARVAAVDSLQRLRPHDLAFGFGQRCIRFVMHYFHPAALVSVAPPAPPITTAPCR